MSEIITPKNLLEDLIQGMTRPLSLKRMLSMNRTQKWFLIITYAGLGVQILAVIVFEQIIQAPFLLYVFWFSWAFSPIGMLGYLVATVIPEFQALRHSEKTALSPVIGSFNAELDLIAHLVQTYECHHLEYAHDCLTLRVQQLRSRIAWVVGVIDKVGLLPLAVTAYFSYRALLEKQPGALAVGSVDWTWPLWVFVATVYLTATYFSSVHQQLDSLCLVLKHAVQTKKALLSADQTNSVGKPGEKPLTVLSHRNNS